MRVGLDSLSARSKRGGTLFVPNDCLYRRRLRIFRLGSDVHGQVIVPRRLLSRVPNSITEDSSGECLKPGYNKCFESGISIGVRLFYRVSCDNSEFIYLVAHLVPSPGWILLTNMCDAGVSRERI